MGGHEIGELLVVLEIIEDANAVRRRRASLGHLRPFENGVELGNNFILDFMGHVWNQVEDFFNQTSALNVDCADKILVGHVISVQDLAVIAVSLELLPEEVTLLGELLDLKLVHQT